MTLREAFQHQIANTRLLIEEDLGPDDPINPVVWNGVILRPNGNYYSNGRPMKVNDQLLVAYVVTFEDTPTPILIEEKAIEEHEDQFIVVRIADNVPVLELKEKSYVY